MGSPQIEVFFLYNSSGAPLTGASPTFDTYKDDQGTNLTQPTITEIGGGAYKFSPDITTNPGRGIVYVINGGATAFPQRAARYCRPEDYAVDLVGDLHDIEFGKWQVFTTGPDANRLVLYRPDGVTVIKKFSLLDQNGSATTTIPYQRAPI